MDIYTVQNIISYFDTDTNMKMRRVSRLFYDNIYDVVKYDPDSSDDYFAELDQLL